ncbi:unnamed protein product [Notodromas monacha]|uniref:Calponin-homology (CH) domain-containing protein n=1 Tax=Notodromas monacha TaxID=399045 RepID=A0A7R9G840_9CRUS|nr:unnamed protein product [Notodromas monacha]CAG0912726.1 unnamed protein product [Notodromas monacha]
MIGCARRLTDSSDIVDCKLKLILGLIWTLILHYSISLPVWEGEEETEGKGPTPKQRLLNWIQNKVPDLPITNFTTDWNDGRAVGALVDAVAPGLCPDWTDWSPNTALQNAREAMDLADNWLGVPQLIKPEEMVDPKVDEQSMMTYLSQYPNAKLKQGAPIRPKTSPTNKDPEHGVILGIELAKTLPLLRSASVVFVAGLSLVVLGIRTLHHLIVRAYGPGIEPTGVVVGAPANFTVETFSAGRGNVEITVENPQGQKEPVDVKFNNDRNLTYSVSYNPRLEGVHKISVKFAGHEIPKSPFKVQVEGFAGDANKVKASGPGLEPEGNMVGRPTYFDIITKDAGRGTPEVIILDPSGNRNTAPVKVTQLTADTWRCEYVASVVGFHSINIFFAGNPISGSPFGVRISPVCDARRVRVTGRGVQANGLRLKDIADFVVHTENAGKAALDVKVIGPGGTNEPVNVRKLDEHNYECTYVPKKEGRYVVTVNYGGHEVPRSPFEVNVGPFKESKIRAFGPGLKGGMVGHPALFTVETNGETGSLGFSIEGPSQAKIECHDNGDGTADVKYYPIAAGEYAVHVLCDNEDIPKSPFMANVVPKSEEIFPDKVECSGPGLNKNGLISGCPTEFFVDTRKAGPGTAPLDVKVMDESYHPVDVHIMDNKNRTYACYYTPVKGIKHTVEVDYNSVATKESPYRVYVEEPTNPAKVAVFGPGVEKGVKSQTPTHFNVDCREAGPGNVRISLRNDHGQDVPIQIHDNENGTFSVDYCAPTPGLHTLNVLYANQVIPQCPIRINVAPHVDIKKVAIEGLEPTGPVNSLQQFRVITKDAGKAQTDVKVVSPSGAIASTHVIPTYEGCLVNFTPTEPGDYKISVFYAGELVPSGPKKFKATPGSDSSKVRAYGPGLEGGTTDKAAEFMIDTRGAGQGGLGVTIEGPSEAAINCRDNGDATCSVAYLPTVPGEYVVNITFNDNHVPGSPFNVKIKPDPMRQITVSGKGVQPDGVFIDCPAEILVDARAVKTKSDSVVQCNIANPSGRKTDAFVQPVGDGTYKISYVPVEEGPHKIDITYDGVPVPESPFVTNVRRGCMPSKCKAGGPGLTKGIVNITNQFTVETKGAGNGGLGLAIEGPSEAKMTCKDNRDGSCTVEYVPTETGEYDVSIKFADTHIPGSPFKVPVELPVDASAVEIKGPGIEPKKCRANTPQKFTVDARKTGKAPLAVNVKSDKGIVVKKPEVKDNGDATYDVTYLPPPEGAPCNVQVQWDGKDVPKSPVKMKVLPKCEPKNVKVSGPALSDKGLAASMPAELVVDTSDAGVADLEVQVLGPDDQPRKVKVVEEPDGKHKATFVPDDVGDYKIKVKYGGEEVPHSPIKAKAHVVGKAEKCQITEGIQETLMIGEEYCITVNAKNAGTGAVTCRIRSVSGNDMDIDIADNGDGTFSIYYKVNDTGEYTISVKFGGQQVPQGSYTVKGFRLPAWEFLSFPAFVHGYIFVPTLVCENTALLMNRVCIPPVTVAVSRSPPSHGSAILALLGCREILVFRAPRCDEGTIGSVDEFLTVDGPWFIQTYPVASPEIRDCHRVSTAGYR